jgi:hypothetical protein
MEAPNRLGRPFAAEILALPKSQPFTDIVDGRVLAQAIVDTIREPLLVLEGPARRHRKSLLLSDFQDESSGCSRSPGLCARRWPAEYPELRLLLENIAPQLAVMEAYEVEQDFSGIGRRTIGYRAMWAAEYETAVRSAVDTARLAGAGSFQTILQAIA